MQANTTVGLDIAKSVFQVHGVEADGRVVIRRQLKRRQVLPLMRWSAPALQSHDNSVVADSNRRESPMRNQPLGAVVYGIDLGKTRFDVVGCDAAGRPIQRVKFSRDTLFKFFAARSKGANRHGGLPRRTVDGAKAE